MDDMKKMKSRWLIVLCIILFILAGFWTAKFFSVNDDNVATDIAGVCTTVAEESCGSLYTVADIKPHNTENDCWQIIDGKVYDVTDLILTHSGGPDIKNFCGNDATETFQGKSHSRKAQQVLADYYIGDLE